MLYYIDIAANKLERIRFEGAFPQTLQAYDLEGTEGLAVDWIGRLVIIRFMVKKLQTIYFYYDYACSTVDVQ